MGLGVGAGVGSGVGVGVGSGVGVGVGSGVGVGVGSGTGVAVGSGVGVGSGAWVGSALLTGSAVSCVTAILGRVPRVVLSAVDVELVGAVIIVPTKAAHRTAPFANPRKPCSEKNSCNGPIGMAITANMRAIILHMDGKKAMADRPMKMVSTHMMTCFVLECFII